MEEEREGFKRDVVGGGGVRLEGRIEEGRWWWQFRPLMAMNGRGRDDDVSMTSSFYFFDLLLF